MLDVDACGRSCQRRRPGGALVPQNVAQNLMRLISEVGEEDDEDSTALRRDAVLTYLELLDKPVLPEVLVQVMSWVLGEYSYLADATVMPPDELLERVCELAERVPQSVRGYCISAALKICAQRGLGSPLPPVVEDLLRKFRDSSSVELHQVSIGSNPIP